MTETEQRILIAELCGWTWWTHETAAGEAWIQPPNRQQPESWRQVARPDNWEAKSTAVPDYPHDLNAMQSALTKLPVHLRQKFLYYFIGTSERTTMWAIPDVWEMLQSTPDKMSEALLRAIGKWKD